MTRIISLATSERLLKKVGAQRVSDEAKNALSEFLEEVAHEIGTKAKDIAKNCGRKTVQASDIKMVKL